MVWLSDFGAAAVQVERGWPHRFERGARAGHWGGNHRCQHRALSCTCWRRRTGHRSRSRQRPGIGSECRQPAPAVAVVGSARGCRSGPLYSRANPAAAEDGYRSVAGAAGGDGRRVRAEDHRRSRGRRERAGARVPAAEGCGGARLRRRCRARECCGPAAHAAADCRANDRRHLLRRRGQDQSDAGYASPVAGSCAGRRTLPPARGGSGCRAQRRNLSRYDYRRDDSQCEGRQRQRRMVNARSLAWSGRTCL